MSPLAQPCLSSTWLAWSNMGASYAGLALLAREDFGEGLRKGWVIISGGRDETCAH
jgi:hypothetical protein